jgi:hypothetical protein
MIEETLSPVVSSMCQTGKEAKNGDESHLDQFSKATNGNRSCPYLTAGIAWRQISPLEFQKAAPMEAPRGRNMGAGFEHCGRVD